MSESVIQKKREDFRKQIRRQHLDQKFRKIRVTLYSTYEETFQAQKNKQLIDSTIHTIEQHNFFELFDEGNYQSDTQAYKHVRDLFMLYEQQLAYPNEQLIYLLQQPIIQAQVRQRWEALHKWEQSQFQTVDTIVKNVANSLCSYSYNEVIVDFLLRTVDFLIYANKVMLMKNIAFKQEEMIYLVGGPDKHYSQAFRLMCKNVLMNFTAPNDDEWLHPFIGQISQIIKQSSYFASVYHNIFLTQEIPLAQKLHMYNDFLCMIENYPSVMHDGDISYPTVFYIILTNMPGMIKTGIKVPYNSAELNYRSLAIINMYLTNAKIVIDAYSSSPYSQQYHDVVMNVAFLLDTIFKEEEWVLCKVPAMDGVIDFIVGRIKSGKELPQIKCARVILDALVKLNRFPSIFSQVCSRKALLPIEIQRLFDKIWKQLFAESRSNRSRLQQNSEQSFENSTTQHIPFLIQKSQNSQYSQLQLISLAQIVKVYKFETNPEVKPWHYLQYRIFEKVLVICNEWMTATVRNKHFQLINHECLEFLSQCMVELLKCRLEVIEEKCNYSIQDVLIGEFFFPSSQNYVNLFDILAFEIEELIRNPQASGILIVEVIIPTLSKLMNRLLKEIKSTKNSYNYDKSTYSSPKEWYEFVQKNKWTIIYHEFSHVHQIHKRLQQFFNSGHKCIDNNHNATMMVNDILKMTEIVQQLIVNEQNCLIELQK